MVKTRTAGNESDAMHKRGRHNRAMVKKSERDPEKVAAGRRLRLTRMALGFDTMIAFAETLGIPLDNLSGYERGLADVPRLLVRDLRSRWAVTYEWIYDGDCQNMPHGLVKKIEKLDS